MDAPTEQDRIYVLHRVLGESQARAAQTAGYSRATGQNREKEPWYSELAAQQRAELIEDERKGLNPLVPKAWEVVGKALADNDKGMAIWVLEKRFGKAIQKQVNDNTGNVVIEIRHVRQPMGDRGSRTAPSADTGQGAM